MKQCSFVLACKEFFQFHQGQSLTQFAAELKQLTDEDKADLISWFPSVGYQIAG
jgi:hypothetical protein